MSHKHFILVQFIWQANISHKAELSYTLSIHNEIHWLRQAPYAHYNIGTDLKNDRKTLFYNTNASVTLPTQSINEETNMKHKHNWISDM